MRVPLFCAVMIVVTYCSAFPVPARVTIPASTGGTGTAVTIPINIENFNKVGAITLKIQYSSSVLSYIELTNWHTAFSSAVVNNSSGVLTIAWENTIPATISSGKMADMRFTFYGDSSALTFSESECEIADTAGTLLSATYTNGSITVLRPSTPVLRQPLNLAASQPVNTAFRWNQAINAVTYQLQIALDNIFSEIFLSDTAISDTSRTVNSLLCNQTYYWRVRGKTATDWGNWSGTYSFSTTQGINAQLTFFIEGFYDSGTNTMLRADTVYAELHSGSSPWTRIDADTNIVSIHGEVTARFTVPDSGNFYIAVKHRNSIESWSANSIHMTRGETKNYDFSSAATQFYGSNAVLKGTKYCVYSADVNQDGIVDFSDLVLIDNDQFNFVSGYVVTDITGDDFVDFSDLSLCDNNQFNFVSVISPLTAKRPVVKNSWTRNR